MIFCKHCGAEYPGIIDLAIISRLWGYSTIKNVAIRCPECFSWSDDGETVKMLKDTGA